MTIPHLTPGTEAMQTLRDCALFRFFPLPDIEKFAAVAVVRDCQPNDPICARGTVGDEFFVALKGEVEITVQTHTNPAREF